MIDPRWNLFINGIFVERPNDHFIIVCVKVDTISLILCTCLGGDMSGSLRSSSDYVEASLKNITFSTPNNNKIPELINPFKNRKRIQSHVNVLNWCKEKSKSIGLMTTVKMQY